MKFSIITCTRNSLKYLNNNINSVKLQTFTDYEHIFIDGFSTDGTVKLINDYRQHNPDRIKLFQYPPLGISDAMNKGIIHSNGIYINHLHADDSLYDKNVLNNLNIFIDKNNKPDWIYGKANFFTNNINNGRIVPYRNIYRRAHFLLLLLTNYLPHQSTFINKKVFKSIGLFRTDLKNSMDYEYWLRMTSNNIESHYIDKIISNCSLQLDAQSQKQAKVAFSENIFVIKQYSPKYLYPIIYFFNVLNNKIGSRIFPN